MTFRLAASAEMLYLDLPFAERVSRLHQRGFEVEIWDWSTKDLPAIASTGAVISSMTGYLRGDLTSDDGIAELLSTAAESLRQAEVVDSLRLNLHGTGLDSGGLPVLPRLAVSGGNLVELVRQGWRGAGRAVGAPMPATDRQPVRGSGRRLPDVHPAARRRARLGG
ncbi:hypothetical protein [Subtercola boreus]|uniref:hypothetical protein n=1 Tax=Subtercola boreus TaxID=120213 RepID=UPI001C0EC6C0|nr:hypothetical protein [Subtercola boreus]